MDISSFLTYSCSYVERGRGEGPLPESRERLLELVVLRVGDSVKVDHTEVAVILVLHWYPLGESSKVVAKVEGSGGLDAREDAGLQVEEG